MLKRRDLRFRAVAALPYLEGVDTGPPGRFELARGWLSAVIVLGPFCNVAAGASALFRLEFEWLPSYAIFKINNQYIEK